MHTQIEYDVYSLAEDVNVTSFQGPGSFLFLFLFCSPRLTMRRVSHQPPSQKGPQVALREGEKLVSSHHMRSRRRFLFCYVFNRKDPERRQKRVEQCSL